MVFVDHPVKWDNPQFQIFYMVTHHNFAIAVALSPTGSYYNQGYLWVPNHSILTDFSIDHPAMAAMGVPPIYGNPQRLYVSTNGSQ